MSKKKVLPMLSRSIKEDYGLVDKKNPKAKAHLQNLTVEDINNLTQALLEHYQKGGKPIGGSCTSMCCV